ncbi:MAG: hypothetical protein U0175_25120 [Caldilineaceae bacterium]
MDENYLYAALIVVGISEGKAGIMVEQPLIHLLMDDNPLVDSLSWSK